MQHLCNALRLLPEYRELYTALDGGASPLLLSGCSAGTRAPLAAALWSEDLAPVVLVCADEREAQQLQQDLRFLCGEMPPILPAREFSFHPATASHQWEHRRLELFRDFRAGKPSLLIVSIEALLQRTLPPEVLAESTFQLSPTGTYDVSQIAERLTALGYTRSEQVEGVGQFALRGGILDVFSPGEALPVRIEFWGDEIDSLQYFDPLTQRRTQHCTELCILPASEVLGNADPLLAPDLYLPLAYQRLCTAVDYLPPDAFVLCCETPRILERARSYLWQVEEDTKTLLEAGKLSKGNALFTKSIEEVFHSLSEHPLAYLDAFSTTAQPLLPKAERALLVKQLPSMSLSLESSAEDLRQYRQEAYAILILTSTQRRADQLQSLLREQGLPSALDYDMHRMPKAGEIMIALGALSAGLEFSEGKLVILSESTAKAKERRPRKSTDRNRKKIESFSDLSVGELVVHDHHGVGRFVGVVTMPIDGVEKDYIKIQFAGADVIYGPVLQLDVVAKYIGSGEQYESRKLSKLGGTEWERAKTKAKKAAKDLAKGLIQLYAQRQRQAGFAFSPDSPWQREFEEQFPYPETDDQLRCVEEIKADMEKPHPMERLLCGDVGYGKTEVAFRAIMKCVLDNKQAAILAPTTVLAQQHYLTAQQRFRQFPVKIDMVSRFRTPTQSRQILREVADGSIDILIGTHKLLNKDMHFQDLGLLVVDEEQRFGVAHKEKLKEMFRQVDVLVLSATPIPRTLNMALSGLRDMSTLEEPPNNRHPVQTYVLEHDWGVLADAMRRELERGGQVYYLHNRVETIEGCAARIQKLLPDARLAVAHGKLEQDALSDIMRDMRENTLDILICTTIIETGVDLPQVNTLIVEDADHLGLSQLHQLRGRVGRSSRRAFAYMTYRKGKVLSEIAERRLGAIREFAAFGSGFKIALRDLEIRGAGNLLGAEQSGFLTSVGYDLYLRLLEEAVLEEQGRTPEKRLDCLVDIRVSASIPAQYISSPEQRMDIYRRIARIQNDDDAEELLDEIIDRYGDPPRKLSNLMAIARIRALAVGCGIVEMSQKEQGLLFRMETLDAQIAFTLCGLAQYRKRLRLSATEKPHILCQMQKGDDSLKLCQRILADWHALLAERDSQIAPSVD